ncbi:MAG: hypothetical protein GY913_23720, partial [Proteobacteria bacterium]|nr:hypothetical protein [Pseudomonadota bacterium]
MGGPTHPRRGEHRSQADSASAGGRSDAGVPSRFRIEMVAETGSTNADLVARAAAGEQDGLVLRTDHQTAGRGRLDRRWDAPPGTNLLFSVLLRPDWPVERFTLVTSGLAVSLVDALGSLFETQAVDVEAMVKWPNDVLLVDRET